MIKEYIKKDGTRAYMFKVYLGKDMLTGKERHTTRRGFKTKREARLELAKLQTQANENSLLYNQNMTFKELYDLWYEGYKTTVKDSTLRTSKSLFINAILPHFSNLTIKKITPTYCQKVVNKWAVQYVNYKKYIIYAKKVLEHAVKLKVIHSNPFQHVQVPRKTKDTSTLYYDKDELKTVLSHLKDCDVFLYTIIHLLAYTGCRIGEILALTWEDVDTFNMKINVDKTTARSMDGLTIHTPKTKTGKRIISIDVMTTKILNDWRNFQRLEYLKHGFNTNNAEQLVFSSVKHNKHMTSSSTAFKYRTFCNKHNIKYINLHGFRHTHASLLLEAGSNIKEVQDRLGHSDVATTMNIYTHITKQSRDKTADKFSKFMNL